MTEAERVIGRLGGRGLGTKQASPPCDPLAAEIQQDRRDGSPVVDHFSGATIVRSAGPRAD
ncbi:MAG: hypothetical protein C0447_01425 [Methylobacterium sp.]|nr:hypothetical protein [Methylobacterium sp.]